MAGPTGAVPHVGGRNSSSNKSTANTGTRQESWLWWWIWRWQLRNGRCASARPWVPIGLAFLTMASILLMWPLRMTTILNGKKDNPILAQKRLHPTKNVTSNIACEWNPNDDVAPCVDFLARRISHALARHTNNSSPPLSQRRWLLLGDSTMALLYWSRPIYEHLKNTKRLLRSSCPYHGYHCVKSVSHGCDTGQSILGMQRRNVWIPPNNLLAEGPKGEGLTNPFCTDCSACKSEVVLCKSGTKQLSQPLEACVLQPATATIATTDGLVEHVGSGSVGGGYIAVEFARDVEQQSDQYQTTQENIVHYVRRDWHLEMQDFGRPICLVQNGHHDAAIPNVALQRYLANVEWYATLLTTACDYIIWLSNNSPARSDFAQTPQQTKEWNDAVHDVLSRYIGRNQTSFVDVYAASIDYPHSDNLHMKPQWYNALGDMFLQVMQYHPNEQVAQPMSTSAPPPPLPRQAVKEQQHQAALVAVNPTILSSVANYSNSTAATSSSYSVNGANTTSVGSATTNTSAGAANRSAAALEISCQWQPQDNGPCVDLLTRRIQASSLSVPAASPLKPRIPRRWMFLGDSSVARVWKHSPLQNHLTNATRFRACQTHSSNSNSSNDSINSSVNNVPLYQCSKIRAGRCDTNEQLKIARRKTGWVRPNNGLAEGPLSHGLTHPYCQDCNGCDSILLRISKTANGTTPSRPPTDENDSSYSDSVGSSLLHGGYVSVEFARDVEIQSDGFTTTQENLVYYIDRDWNTAELRLEWGRPVCLVATGFHDVALPNITLSRYVANVRWYLDLLTTVCDHIVWLANTCPETDNFAQKKVQTREWNEAVRDILFTNDDLRQKASYLDVYEASISYKHKDNLHMIDEWYDLLGRMLLEVMEGMTTATTSKGEVE